MSDLSQALREAYSRSDSSTRHLVALELLHPLFPGGALRNVGWDSDVSVGGNLYIGLGMEIQQPDYSTEPATSVKVRVDGVPGTYQFYINNALSNSSQVVSAQITALAYNTTTQSVIDYQAPFAFKLMKAEYNMESVILTLGWPAPTNMPFPAMKYDAANFPYLFKQ